VTETLELHVFSCLWKSVYYFYGNLEEPERSWEKGGVESSREEGKRRRHAERGRNRSRGENVDDLR